MRGRGYSHSVCIVLEKRPNGRKLKHPKPLRIPLGTAEDFVEIGRASFISKGKYRAMKAEAKKAVKKAQ